ncbi:MAG TPA: hypothetical protein VG826_14460 [Pirellulales bacterium]|nr:hypothetical protein [Pirellulales bacterium]
MEPLEQLAKMSQGVTELHATFVKQIDTVQDEGMRQYMIALAARLQQLHGEAMQAFPKAYSTLRTEVAATQKQNAEVLSKIDILKAKQAEAQAQAAAAAKANEAAVAAARAKQAARMQIAAVAAGKAKTPPIPPMSAELSDALRDELLARFGLKQAPRNTPQPYEEAAEDWQRSKPAHKTIVPL